jgi:hypothetical protein
MSAALTIIAAVAGGWIVLIMSLKGLAVLLRRQTVKAVKAALGQETPLMISDNTSYLGADFRGPNLPPRTSGVLALTAERLYFLPWFPRKSITLPRESISEVLTRPLFRDLGYNIPALIMVVKGVGDPDGEMGWLVRDPEGWKREIKSILPRRSMKEE